MKNLLTIINLCVIFAIASIFATTDRAHDNVSATDKLIGSIPDNQTTRSGFVKTNLDDNASVDESIREFLIESTEARLMDLEEGKTAQQRSTTRRLKEYGALMVKDQSAMLAELQKLAALKKVTLPATLGEAKADGLADLKEEHGKSFDKKFIKMMTIDHKRDVKLFEKATRSSDADVQVFATKYFPIVQSHLAKIRSLKSEIK